MSKEAKAVRFTRRCFAAAVVFISAFCFILLSPASVRPAQANFAACVEAASNSLELIEYVSGKAADIAACSDKLSASPPLSAAVVTILTALAIAGEFDTEAECNGLVGSTITRLLGSLLEEAPIVKKTMADIFGQPVVDGLLNAGGAAAVETLASIPGIDRVFGLLDCGCTAVGAVLETKDKVAEIAKQLASCADFANEAAGAFVEVLQSGQDWLFGPHKGDWGTQLTIDPNNICSTAFIPADQYDVYSHDFAVKHAGVQYYPSEKLSQSCSCPAETKVVFHQDTRLYECSCGEGKYLTGGQCHSVCAYDSYWDSKQHGCAPRCDAGGLWDGYNCRYFCPEADAVYNTQKHACEVCGPGTQALRYLSGTADNGLCQPCAADEKGGGGSNACEPICDPSKPWIKYDPKHWAGPGCHAVCEPGKQFIQFAELKGQSCVTCGANTVLNTETNTCDPCAKGATWVATGAMGAPACACPNGTAPVDGVCSVCPEGSTLSTDMNGGSVCVACPDCGKEYKRPVRDCGSTAIPDPANPYTQCIPCAAGSRAYGTFCIPEKGIVGVTASGKAASDVLVKASTDGLLVRDTNGKGECAPGWERNGPYCTIPALVNQQGASRIPRANCAAWGDNYVSDPRDPNRCLECATGSAPNKDRTACVKLVTVRQPREPITKPQPRSPENKGTAALPKEAPRRTGPAAPDLDLELPGGGSNFGGAVRRPAGAAPSTPTVTTPPTRTRDAETQERSAPRTSSSPPPPRNALPPTFPRQQEPYKP